MKAGLEEFTQAIVRDLQIEHVDVLQAVVYVSDMKDPVFFCECIDDDELEDQKGAIADSPNPLLAKKAYATKPSLFFVKISGLPFKASLMSKEDIRRTKAKIKAGQGKLKKLF